MDKKWKGTTSESAKPAPSRSELKTVRPAEPGNPKNELLKGIGFLRRQQSALADKRVRIAD
jgi:hypothetical protein